MENRALFQYAALIVLLGVFGAFFAYAWNPPSVPPPQGNAPPPLTVSSATEEKVGIPGFGNFPESHRGIIAVNDIFIQALNRWVSSLSPGYAGAVDNDALRPDQDIAVKIVSSGSQSPEASCPAGYTLIGCSGSRVFKSSDAVRDERQYDYWGTLQLFTSSGNPWSGICRTEIAPFSYAWSNHRPVAYAYCAKSKYYECGFPGIPCD